MSLLWIERARRALEPSARAGLAVGRDYVGFAELVAAGGGWRVAALDEGALEAPLFSGAPTAQAAAALARSLRPFADRLRRRYLPLHVSIPDAAVRCAMFELDALPKSRQAQLDLVRFRFGRQGTNRTPASARCSRATAASSSFSAWRWTRAGAAWFGRCSAPRAWCPGA